MSSEPARQYAPTEPSPFLAASDGPPTAPPDVGADEGKEPEDNWHFTVRGLLEILTVAALLLYGAVHFGESAFYARLGVSPDEVGLDYGATLSKVAVGMALFAATIGLLLMAGYLLAPSGSDAKARGTVQLVGATVAIAFGQLLLRTLLPPVPIWEVLVGTTALILIGAVLGPKHRSGELRRWWGRFDHARALAFGAPLIVAAFGFAGLAGHHAAGYVLAGEDLPCGCSKLFGLNLSMPWVSGSRGFMGIEAERADVAWAGAPERGIELPVDPIYLGTAEGMVVLYDVERRATVRVPAQVVSVATEPRHVTWR